jgi:hypothetical protein
VKAGRHSGPHRSRDASRQARTAKANRCTGTRAGEVRKDPAVVVEVAFVFRSACAPLPLGGASQRPPNPPQLRGAGHRKQAGGRSPSSIVASRQGGLHSRSWRVPRVSVGCVPHPARAAPVLLSAARGRHRAGDRRGGSSLWRRIIIPGVAALWPPPPRSRASRARSALSGSFAAARKALRGRSCGLRSLALVALRSAVWASSQSRSSAHPQSKAKAKPRLRDRRRRRRP